jgi:glycerol uptake facilitator-like aquaporin
MFLTIQLVLVIFMLAVEKHRATFLAPLGIGLSLFICHMTGETYSPFSSPPPFSLLLPPLTSTLPVAFDLA